MEFTDRELSLLSEGILNLMCDAGNAAKMLTDKKCIDAINNHIKELRKLNTKICNYMEG